MGAPSPRHTAEFKQKAVELYKKSGTTYAEVTRGPGCDAGSLSDWVKKADAADCGARDDPFQMAEDLARRRFSADGPNMAWFADIACVKTRQGWLYLALAMSIWSRRIVGWAMGPSITAELADEAPKMALARRNNPEGCIHHSDHESQYVSLLLSRTMREHGIRPSMGSIPSPWDNAAMESLMGIVKSECVHARVYATRDEAALDIFEYIEVVYNRARIHSALGYMSPAEFEKANWPNDEGRSKAA